MGTFCAGPHAREHRTHDALVDRLGYRPVPALVQWMVTGDCSGRCNHCMTWPGRSMEEMDDRSVEAFLDDIAAMGVDEVLLQETMSAIAAKSESWRHEIFEGKLHPFLHRDDPAFRHAFLSKAGTPRALRQALRSAPKLWGTDDPRATITRSYLQEHPFAESARLQVTVPPGAGMQVRGACCWMLGCSDDRPHRGGAESSS